MDERVFMCNHPLCCCTYPVYTQEHKCVPCVRGCFPRSDLLPGHVHVSGHTVSVLLIACTYYEKTCCNHYHMTLDYKEALLAGKNVFFLMFESSGLIWKFSFLFLSGNDLMHGLLVCGQHCVVYCGKAIQLLFMNDEICIALA